MTVHGCLGVKHQEYMYLPYPLARSVNHEQGWKTSTSVIWLGLLNLILVNMLFLADTCKAHASCFSFRLYISTCMFPDSFKLQERMFFMSAVRIRWFVFSCCLLALPHVSCAPNCLFMGGGKRQGNEFLSIDSVFSSYVTWHHKENYHISPWQG